MSDYNYFERTNSGLSFDLASLFDGFDGLLWDKTAIGHARDAMQDLVRGSVANPSEDRMVGHYWLRAPELAPEKSISDAIQGAWQALDDFMVQIGERFGTVVWVGTGGSSLGPQLIAGARLGQPGQRRIDFLDNCDPETFEHVLRHRDWNDTLFVIVSKSGRTSETMSALDIIEAEAEQQGVQLKDRLVAITTPGSDLEQRAQSGGWLATFPLWNWVGGRTSIFSSVGLLALMLVGGDRASFLQGARAMDVWTLEHASEDNPALALAAALAESVDCGWPNLVLLPYCDRLELLGRYLQQLIMESVGKQTIVDGETVGKGLTVYGNKGTTDQHAFVQQLREGSDDAVVGFIEVLRDRKTDFHPELYRATSDSLSAFLAGTRKALMDVDRLCFTVTLERLDAASLGGLIAFWERVVGYIAALWNLNAYDQPGVEAGKKAAKGVLALQDRLYEALQSNEALTAEDWAERVQGDESMCFHILRRLAANDRIAATGSGRDRVFSRTG